MIPCRLCGQVHFHLKNNSMKFGVVIFPGSNCDEDIIYVLEKIMGQQVVRLWHKDHDLQGADFIVLPGGFSFWRLFTFWCNWPVSPQLCRKLFSLLPRAVMY